MIGERRIRFHLSEELMDLEAQEGILHSSFSHAVNFSFTRNDETRIVTVLMENAPVLPDSLVLPASAFYNVKNMKEKTVRLQKTCFQAGSTCIKLPSECMTDLFLPNLVKKGIQTADLGAFFILQDRMEHLDQFIKKQTKRSDIEQLPERYRKKLWEFAEAFLLEENHVAEQRFKQLVGAGKGLTPSCDDAMTGVLAVACFYKMMIDPVNGCRCYFLQTRGILHLLKTRQMTTKISEKYLKCVSRGTVSQPLGELLQWIFGITEHFPENAAGQIAATGHTSGMDTLYGVRGMVKCVKNLLSSPKMHNNLKNFLDVGKND